MARARVPVDLFNPGQVFACLGLAEAARALHGDARGGFVEEGARVWFEVSTSGDADPVVSVLTFLRDAKVRSLSPDEPGGEKSLATGKWSVDTHHIRHREPFPYARPDSPAALPAILESTAAGIVIDHWADSTSRDNVKFWAGAGGYPGVGLLRDALDLARPHLPTAVEDPFAVSAPQSSSFRFDWRRDYTALGIGFSLNNHGKISPVGYPVTEILAAIGLGHARPLRPSRSDKLLYRYAVALSRDLPLPLLRAALGCAPLPLPTRTFRMNLDWPGQEGQARCITDVTEES